MTQGTSCIYDVFLQKLNRFVPLGSEERALVQGWPAAAVRVEKKAELPRTSGCRVLVSGIAAQVTAASDGQRPILAFHFPGDLIDYPHPLADKVNADAIAISDLVLVSLAREVLVEAMTRHPRFNQALWMAAGVDAAIGRDWLLNVGHRDARAALAHLICELCVRAASDDGESANSYTLPMTQEHLGSALGLTAIHVNRTLRGLQDEGLIRYRIGRVTVTDLDRLRKIGEFDPTYLRGI